MAVFNFASRASVATDAKNGRFLPERKPPVLLVDGSRPQTPFSQITSAAARRSGAFSKTHYQVIAASFLKISLAHCHSFSCRRSISTSADTRKWSKVSRFDFDFRNSCQLLSAARGGSDLAGVKLTPTKINGSNWFVDSRSVSKWPNWPLEAGKWPQ